MRKTTWTIAVIGATLLVVLMMTGGMDDPVAMAEFATVERADVHLVVPIYGQIVYTDDRLITASMPGVVSQICVKAGDRIGAQAALVRIETPYAEDALSAFAAGQEHIGGIVGNQPSAEQVKRVVRAEDACTVRQVFVEEGSRVTAGTPLVRISSSEQRVLCQAAPTDAAKISPGMWAWLTTEGEALCLATVESVGEKTTDTMTGLAVQKIVLQPEKELELPEHSSVDADVYLAGSDDVLSLPLNAITDRSTVWWVNDGRCTEIPAQVVMSDEMRAWVHLPEGIKVAIGEFSQGQRIKEVRP